MPKVYIVDDEPNIRHLFELVLKDDGYEVLSFASGRELKEKAPVEPDVLIIDLLLPGDDGATIASRCRKEWGWGKVRFCFVTGSLTLNHFLAGGKDLMLEKPVSIDVLRESVRTLTRPAAWKPLHPGVSPWHG
ncbi:MAG: response regulator [Bacillota bacterium]|nr:response regulator [Bacillota bacterium]